MHAADKNRVAAPDQHHDHHDGGDLHDAESLVAGLLNALDVLPPVIGGGYDGKEDGEVVGIEMQRLVTGAYQRRRQPAMLLCDDQQLVDEPGNVLPGGNAGDRPRQDVIEHQGRDADLGEGAAKRLLYDAIDAAAREHGTAFDVNRANGEAEEHDRENEPWRGGADRLFRNAAGVEGRRGHVIENDRSGTPEGDECEHHGRCHNQTYAVRRWGYGRSGRCHGMEIRLRLPVFGISGKRNHRRPAVSLCPDSRPVNEKSGRMRGPKLARKREYSRPLGEAA